MVTQTRVVEPGPEFSRAIASLRAHLDRTDALAYSSAERAAVTGQFLSLPSLKALELTNRNVEVEVDAISLDGCEQREWLDAIAQRLEGSGGGRDDQSEVSRPLELTLEWARSDVRISTHTRGSKMSVVIGLPEGYGRCEGYDDVDYRAHLFRTALKASRVPTDAEVRVVDGRVAVTGDRYFALDDAEEGDSGPERIILRPIRSFTEQVAVAQRIIDAFGRRVLQSSGTFEFDRDGYESWRSTFHGIGLPCRLSLSATLTPEAEGVWSGVWPEALDWIPLGRWDQDELTLEADAMMADSGPSLVFRGYSFWRPIERDGCSEEQLRETLGELLS